MSLWEKVIAFILDLISGRYFDAGREAGRVEIATKQKEEADALRADYDEIAGDARTLDDAVDGLRARAARRAGHKVGRPGSGGVP